MALIARNYFDMLISRLSDPQSKFVRAVISKDFVSAKKLAYELYKERPQYLAFFCYVHLKDHKQILLAVLKKVHHVDPQLVYCLAKSEGVSYLELQHLQSKFSGPSFIERCIRKAMLLKKYDESSQIGVVPSFEPDAEKESLNRMILEIDDFSLYDLAIRRKVEIYSSESINYQWYLVAKEKNTNSAIRILKKSTSFQEVQELVRYFRGSPTELSRLAEPGSVHDILIKYLEGGYSKDILQCAWSNFCGKNTHLNLKILLALLIASREEKNIVLAFYLSHKHASSDNYEIDLIHLFLNRYFMFHANVARMLEKLEIKNVQQHNLAYIWSDPMILSSIRLNNRISSFQAEIREQINSIETGLRKFIDSNRIACAASMLALREKLTGSVVLNEIENCKILCTEPKTMFSGILGDSCSYMFDKITVTDTRAEAGSISSIRSTSVQDCGDDIFDNEIFPIRDKGFMSFFLKMNTDKCKRQ